MKLVISQQQMLEAVAYWLNQGQAEIKVPQPVEPKHLELATRREGKFEDSELVFDRIELDLTKLNAEKAKK